MPPNELCQLNCLRELHLDHNRLTMLPSSISNLSHLAVLNLSHNPIGALPAEIGKIHVDLWLSSQKNKTILN